MCPLEDRSNNYTAVIVKVMNGDKEYTVLRFCSLEHFQKPDTDGPHVIEQIVYEYKPPEDLDDVEQVECCHLECPRLFEGYSKKKKKSKDRVPATIMVYPRDKEEDAFHYCDLTCLVAGLSTKSKKAWTDLCKNSVPSGKQKKKKEDQRGMEALLRQHQTARSKSQVQQSQLSSTQ